MGGRDLTKVGIILIGLGLAASGLGLAANLLALGLCGPEAGWTDGLLTAGYLVVVLGLPGLALVAASGWISGHLWGAEEGSGAGALLLRVGLILLGAWLATQGLIGWLLASPSFPRGNSITSIEWHWWDEWVPRHIVKVVLGTVLALGAGRIAPLFGDETEQVDGTTESIRLVRVGLVLIGVFLVATGVVDVVGWAATSPDPGLIGILAEGPLYDRLGKGLARILLGGALVAFARPLAYTTLRIQPPGAERD